MPSESGFYRFIVRSVIRLSNGKIQNPSSINAILITLSAIVITALFLILFFIGFGGTRVIRGGPGPSQKELDAYRKIQPF